MLLKLGLGFLHALQLHNCKHQAHNRRLTRPQLPGARERRRKTVGHPLTLARRSRQQSHLLCTVPDRCWAILPLANALL